MGYVFISYSTKDQTSADTIRYLLSENNIDCWMAPYDIPPGSKYASVITKAIRDCSCFLLILTNASQASEAVDSEVELAALTFKKPIITISLEDVVLNDSFTFYIHNKQIIAIRELDESSVEIANILDAVVAFTGKKLPPLNVTPKNNFCDLIKHEALTVEQGFHAGDKENKNNTNASLNLDGTVNTTNNETDTISRMDEYHKAKGMLTCGWFHTVGVDASGRVIASGDNQFGECNVQNWHNIIQVAAGKGFTIGLKNDGTLVSCGNNDVGQCNINDWRDISLVTCGENFTIGVKKNGTIVYTGCVKFAEKAHLKRVLEQTDIVKCVGGGDQLGGYIVALKSDGSMFYSGFLCSWLSELKEWKDITDFAFSPAFGDLVVGLRYDGSVVVCSRYNKNLFGDVASWKNIVSLSCGSHIVGLKSNGRVITSGENKFGRCNTENWRNVVCIASSSYYTIGLNQKGQLLISGGRKNGIECLDDSQMVSYDFFNGIYSLDDMNKFRESWINGNRI